MMSLIGTITKIICKQSVVFTKFASYSVVILTHQKPDSYSALASSLVRVGWSDDNNIITFRPADLYQTTS